MTRTESKTTLVFGGTSGLGLEIAKNMRSEGSVVVTGRHDPEVDGIDYKELELHDSQLSQKLGQLILELDGVHTMVHAAGYYQEGRITELNEDQIEEMLDVGGRSLIYAVRSVLKEQDTLDELITITSTSQWVPRQYEPVYNFIKAGGAHFSNAMAEDGRVEHVLVVGPAGMHTAFWNGVERDDKDGMLEPSWVAGEIMKIREQDYRYKFVKILREPPRIEEVEQR